VSELLAVATERPRTISTSSERDALLRLLSGHDEMHAQGSSDSSGRALYRHRAERIDPDLFRAHLAGKAVVASYLVRRDGTVRMAVLDIDIAAKTLLRHRYDDERLSELRQRALSAARSLLGAAESLGLAPVVEDSGGRGYHLWFLFEDPVPAERARAVLLAVRDHAGALPDGINLEVFPAHDRAEPEVPGNRMRLPCGVHPVTRRASRILDRQMQTVAHPLQAILGARRIARCDLERCLTGTVRPAPAAVAAADPVTTMLDGCAVLKALVGKAADLRHLAHHERWVLASCLKPLGEAREAAVHRIIGQCQNYDRSQTGKNLRRIYDQPIGCRRIQLMLPGLTTTKVCRCRLPQRAGRYPSPTCLVGILPIRPGDDPAKCPSRNTSGTTRPTPPERAVASGVAERLQRARHLARNPQAIVPPEALAVATAPSAATPPLARDSVPAPAPPAPASATLPPDDADDEALVAAVLAAQESLQAGRARLAGRIAAAGGNLRTARGSLRLVDGRPCLEL